MKLLVVTTFAHPDHHGGAERLVTDVAERLAERGHGVTLLTSDPGGAPARERRAGVEWRRYPVQRHGAARFWRSVFTGVRAALRDGVGAGADVVALYQVASAIPVLAPGGLRAPTVMTFAAPYHREYLARFRDGRDEGPIPLRAAVASRVLRLADRYVVSRSDEVLVLSRFSAGQVVALGGRPPVVAPAGVDLVRFHPAADDRERRAARVGLGLPDDGSPLVLSVRRLVPRMGLGDLIDAAGALRREGRPLRVALAGEGPEREALAARARGAGLGDHVHLLGRLDEADLPTLYRAADVFVLPTRSLEGFGMATAEALASGLPVVATSTGGTLELLDDLDGAALVPPGDPAALAAALRPLLGDGAGRRRSGSSARERAESRLTWDGHLDALQSAARRAMDRHAGDGAP